MKRDGPRFPQFERLEDGDERYRRPTIKSNRTTGKLRRRELDELIPEDGRVIGENGDAE